jgi:hypothetical protein
VKSSWRDINTSLAGDCNGTSLRGMLELTVAASGSHKILAVFFKKPDDILHFHVENNKVFSALEEDA